MEAILDIAVEALGLVPLVLVFYVPALLGVAVWSERGRAYRLKAALMVGLGCGAVLAVQILFTSTSALQAAQTIGIALAQIVAALALAAFTVYKLAD